jgi:hypothetical protein
MFFKKSKFATLCAVARDTAQIDLKGLDRKLNGVLEKFANDPKNSSISAEGLLVKCLARAMNESLALNLRIPDSEIMGASAGLALGMAMDGWRAGGKYGEDIRQEFWEARNRFEFPEDDE